MIHARASIHVVCFTFCILLLPSAFPSQRQVEQQPEFVKQGRQLMREGKLEEALAVYQQTLQKLPDSPVANTEAGNVLDLMGRGPEARGYFQKAIDAADTPERKAMAERAMAISYAFEADCGKASDYERRVFEYYGSVRNFYQQGEIADEAGRVCIDAAPDDRRTDSNLDSAARWYALGHQTGLKEPDIQPARVDLWDFRWEHAEARLAARRGEQATAQKDVAAAKAVLDKGKISQQEQFFPYLEGYVAFYGGDYKRALADFLKANQDDPFIECMLGRTYEKLGEKAEAIDYYRKAAAAISHNPPAAYAVPFAKKRLAALRG